MDTLALKIVITPALILAASLAGRRWGEAVGGWLVALPLTSGPVVFFLALDHGARFAAMAAVGSLSGVAAQACFGVAYSRSAATTGWPAALACGAVAFAASGALLQAAGLPLPWLFLLDIVALAAAIRVVPRDAAREEVAASPRGDLPARAAVGTAIVVGITAAAPMLGPRLSGLLSTFPVFASVLAIFAHRTRGAAGAQQVFYGLLAGMYSFAGFFLVLGALVERLGVAAGFAAAAMTALTIQAGSLWAMRHNAQSM